MEAKVLGAVLQDRKAWEVVKEHLDPKELTPEGAIILDLAGEYYGADLGCSSVDRDILCVRVDRRIVSGKSAAAIKGIIAGLPQVSVPNVLDEVIAVKRHNLGLRLSTLLSGGKCGDEVQSLMEEYGRLVGQGSKDVGGSEDFEVQDREVRGLLEKSFNDDNLIQLWPSALNSACDGGARPGHHILVFAPTEMGKTLFVINLCAGFTAQGLRTLYIGNEDPSADIMMRYITRIVGKDKFTIKKNPDKAQEICNRKNYDLLTLVSLAPGNFRQIRKLVDKYNPHVVVLDQLRNLDVDSENRTQALEKAATEARNLGKSKNILVVSVAQAGDSASGKRILNRGDVDGSNVGIPGQVDLMIGIGADDEMENMNLRMLSFPKNKLSGKHEPITVTIDPTTSRVIEDEVNENEAVVV